MSKPLKQRIAVLLTCHNRCSKTLACLATLFQNQLEEGRALDAFLVDDGSTDGTGDAIRKEFPVVHLIGGDGHLYWNGGMRLAFAAAMEQGYDYYVWLNDDTLLYPTAIQGLVTTADEIQAKQGKSAIVVGSIQDAKDGRHTYGGMNRLCKWKATTFTLTAPRDVPIECETMNGNCVLIPNEVALAVGNLEPAFAHAMGDLDYGLRARHEGFTVWVMPGFVGTCSRNSTTGSFNDASLPVAVRLRKMMQPTGLPPSSWRVFTQRHVGIMWPLFWMWPYARVLTMGLIHK